MTLSSLWLFLPFNPESENVRIRSGKQTEKSTFQLNKVHFQRPYFLLVFDLGSRIRTIRVRRFRLNIFPVLSETVFANSTGVEIYI